MLGQLILILILVATGFSMVYFQDYIRANQRKVALVVGVIMLISRIGRNTEYFLAAEYHRALPLQLCTISSYLALLWLFVPIKQLRPFLFFYGFLGLTAFIDPDVPSWSEAVRTFYLYGFTIDHVVITLLPLYLVLYDDYKFDLKEGLVPLVAAVVLVFASWPLNVWWDAADFFYMKDKPVFSDLFGRSDPFGFDLLTLGYIAGFFFAYFVFNAVNLLLIKLVTKNPHYLTNKGDA